MKLGQTNEKPPFLELKVQKLNSCGQFGFSIFRVNA
jgi:hypothetical protein